jgi:ATP-dependent Lon protease
MKIQEMANEKNTKKTSNRRSNDQKAGSCSSNKKRNESSDNDDSSSDDDMDMDDHEYRKLLSKMFPSKHMDKKVESGEKLKKAFKRLRTGKKDEESDDDIEVDEESEEEEEEEPMKKTRKISKNSKDKTEPKSPKGSKNSEKRNKKENKNHDKKVAKSKSKKKVVESESESESEEDEDDDDIPEKSSKFNIIFTIGGGEDDDDDEEWEYDEDEWEDDEEWETEDEDEDVSSSDEDEDEDEDEWEDVEEEEEEEESEEENVILTRRRAKNNKKTNKEKEEGEISEDDTVKARSPKLKKASSNNDFLNQLKELYKQNKDNEEAKECLEACEETLKKHEKKQKKKEKKYKEKNVRIFRKLAKDKNTNNDFEFFGKLEIDEQKKIIKELREINTLIRVEKPYRLTLLEADMPPIFKGAAMKKINSLRYMEPGSGDYYKIKNWVDTFMRIPFGKYNQLPINIDHGVDVCHDFMENAKNSLDTAVYGLDDAKMQIMQMLGQLITNPTSVGTAIAIQGPMGTGKTTLVKEGISKILNRPFAFIALGGATDSSFLEGHSYTYEGSTWGKIVQILVDSKCMNPVIYFDELDKISDTPKGEEIAGILTHLTDTSQNSQFHDKYFAEVDFDLSKCLFIFSYNDENKINPILRDRMYRIHTKGYDKKQKTIIANDYLLPNIRSQVKFTPEDIIIPETTLHYIMENYCNKEDGVRNMKRCLEIIYTKLNLYRLMKPDTNLFQESMSLKVEFPFTVTIDVANKLIKKDNEINVSYLGLYT